MLIILKVHSIPSPAGDGAELVGGEGGRSEELTTLGEARPGTAVSVSVGPTTVHILNQVSSSHFDISSALFRALF